MGNSEALSNGGIGPATAVAAVGSGRAASASPPSASSSRGFRYLETDASDDSRPIRERLGFSAVTTTTPYVWSPPTVPAAER